MEIGTAGTRKDTQRSPKLLNGSGDGFVLTVQKCAYIFTNWLLSQACHNDVRQLAQAQVPTTDYTCCSHGIQQSFAGVSTSHNGHQECVIAAYVRTPVNDRYLQLSDNNVG